MQFGKEFVGAGTGFDKETLLSQGPIGVPLSEKNAGFLKNVWEGLKDVPQSLGYGGREYQLKARPAFGDDPSVISLTIIEHRGGDRTDEAWMHIDPTSMTVIGTGYVEDNPRSYHSTGGHGKETVSVLFGDKDDYSSEIRAYLEEFEAATGTKIPVRSYLLNRDSEPTPLSPKPAEIEPQKPPFYR